MAYCLALAGECVSWVAIIVDPETTEFRLRYPSLPSLMNLRQAAVEGTLRRAQRAWTHHNVTARAALRWISVRVRRFQGVCARALSRRYSSPPSP